jgi:allantoicase
VARLRVHGEVVPDPAMLEGLTVDLAELDTSWYRGNQPESASLQTLDASTGASLTDDGLAAARRR